MTPCFLPELHSQCKLLTLPSQQRWRKRCDSDHRGNCGHRTESKKPNLTTETRRHEGIAAHASAGNYNPIDKIRLKVSSSSCAIDTCTSCCYCCAAACRCAWPRQRSRPTILTSIKSHWCRPRRAGCWT